MSPDHYVLTETERDIEVKPGSSGFDSRCNLPLSIAQEGRYYMLISVNEKQIAQSPLHIKLTRKAES